MSDTKLTIPTIHLNGTGKVALCSALEEAAQAIFRAREKLALTAPHGRDYYPQDVARQGETLQKALLEYDKRALALWRVEEELMAIWEAITDTK